METISETAGPDKYHLCREESCSGLLNEAFYSNCDQSDQPPIHCLCASATHHKGPHILSLNDNQPFYYLEFEKRRTFVHIQCRTDLQVLDSLYLKLHLIFAAIDFLSDYSLLMH